MVKKTDFNSKIREVESTIPSITALTTNSALTAVGNKIPDVTNLVTKTDYDAGLQKISDRVTSNKSKHLLVENELKKFEEFDAAYFRSKNYSDGNDGTKNYLVFQTISKILAITYLYENQKAYLIIP